MKDLFTSFLSTGAIQVANIVTGVLAARLLLPEGRGDLAFLLLWPAMIADIGAFGVNTAVSYYSARKEFPPQRIFAGAVVIVTALSVVLMAVFAFLIPVLFTGHRAALTGVGWVFLVFIPIHLFLHCVISQFQGALEFTIFNVLRAKQHYCYLGFVLLFILLFDATAATFAYAFLAANAVTLVTGVSLVRRQGWLSLAPGRDVLRALLAYGVRFHVSVLLAIANRRLDLVVITLVLPSADLGLYVVAGTVQGLPMIIATTMDILVFPKIAAQTGEAGRREVFERYLRATLVLVLPATGALILVAPYLIRAIFGAPFVGATDAARLLLAAAVPFTFKILVASYFRAANRMAVVSKAELIGMIVSAVALLALIPSFGIVGAAIANAIAVLVPAIYFLARAQIDIRSLMRFSEGDMDLLRELMRRIARRKAG